jgi:hypothetical protein
MKRLTRPGLGFGGFWTARRTLARYEAMAMMRKGQVRNIGGRDIRTQANVHRRTISSRRWRGELGPLADDPPPNPKRCNSTRDSAPHEYRVPAGGIEARILGISDVISAESPLQGKLTTR